MPTSQGSRVLTLHMEGSVQHVTPSSALRTRPGAEATLPRGVSAPGEAAKHIIVSHLAQVLRVYFLADAWLGVHLLVWPLECPKQRLI